MGFLKGPHTAHANITRWVLYRSPLLCDSPETPAVCISRGNQCCRSVQAPCAAGSPDLLEEGRAGHAEAGHGQAVCRDFCRWSDAGGTGRLLPSERRCMGARGRRVALEGGRGGQCKRHSPLDFTCAPAIRAQWGRGGSGRHQCHFVLLLHPFLQKPGGGEAKSASACEQFIVSLSPL